MTIDEIRIESGKQCQSYMDAAEALGQITDDQRLTVIKSATLRELVAIRLLLEDQKRRAE